MGSRRADLVAKLERLLSEPDEARIQESFRRVCAVMVAWELVNEFTGRTEARAQMEDAGVDAATLAAVLADPGGYFAQHGGNGRSGRLSESLWRQVIHPGMPGWEARAGSIANLWVDLRVDSETAPAYPLPLLA